MIALTILGALYLMWALFLAVMCLATAKAAGKLGHVATVIGAPLLLLALALDVCINLLSSIPFADLPREWTFSQRLSRYLPRADWRGRAALWIGANLLDPFDPSGSHLRRP